MLLLTPQALLTLNGVQTDAIGLTLARLLGAEFIGFNIATFLARSNSDVLIKRWVVRGHLASESLGFIVALLAKLAGLGNSLFWGIVLIFFVFALGYAYFNFVRPQSA